MGIEIPDSIWSQLVSQVEEDSAVDEYTMIRVDLGSSGRQFAYKARVEEPRAPYNPEIDEMDEQPSNNSVLLWGEPRMWVSKQISQEINRAFKSLPTTVSIQLDSVVLHSEEGLSIVGHFSRTLPASELNMHSRLSTILQKTDYLSDEQELSHGEIELLGDHTDGILYRTSQKDEPPHHFHPSHYGDFEDGGGFEQFEHWFDIATFLANEDVEVGGDIDELLVNRVGLDKELMVLQGSFVLG